MFLHMPLYSSKDSEASCLRTKSIERYALTFWTVARSSSRIEVDRKMNRIFRHSQYGLIDFIKSPRLLGQSFDVREASVL